MRTPGGRGLLVWSWKRRGRGKGGDGGEIDLLIEKSSAYASREFLKRCELKNWVEDVACLKGVCFIAV